MEYPWKHNRPFNAYANYFREMFGERVQKLSIDAGLSCPNRDGRLSATGCTYCNNEAFNPSYCNPDKSISRQISEGIEFHEKRYRRANKYLAYFQTYSNTYAPVDKLKAMYDEALSFPQVTGLVIGTRPDCIDEEKLMMIRELARYHYIIIEYGLESSYNKTLERINRGHSFEQSVWALETTKSFGLKTGAHLIFGLPGESREEMLEEADIVSQLPLDTIKFHQLQIIKGTIMANEYKKDPAQFDLFSLEEYIDFIIRFTEKLNPNIVIERFAGEVPPRFVAGGGWGKIRNDQILNRIEQKMLDLQTWQGRKFRD